MIWIGPLLGSSERPKAFASRVDRDLLPALLRDWAPRVSVQASSPIDGGERLDIVSEIREFRDFRPERLFESVPGLKSLSALRRVIQELRDTPVERSLFARRLVDAGADAAWVWSLVQRLAREAQESGDSSAQQGSDHSPGTRVLDDAVSGILDLVDLPGVANASSTETRAPLVTSPDPLQSLIRKLGGYTGRKRQVEKRIASELLLEIDSLLGAHLASILHHSDFVRLETAWRGLKFLVDRTDFKKGVVLEVVPAAKENLAGEMARLVEREETASTPLVAVWVDVEFDATVRDIETLARIGELAASMNVPVVAAVGPRFFGLSQMQELNHVSPFWDFLKRPEYIPFVSLKERACAGSIALALPRLLLRLPYGKSNPVRGLDWDEAAEDSWREARWSRPLAAIASAVTAAFARSGWASDFTDPIEGRVGDLPIDAVRGQDGREFMAPLDAVLTDSIVDELGRSGFTVLSASGDSDAVTIARAPMLAGSGPGSRAELDTGIRPEQSLPYQMLAALVVGVIRRLASTARASTPATISEHFRNGMFSELRLEADRLRVEAAPATEGSSRFQVDIHLRLPVPLGGVETQMDLAIEVGS
jgi:type VI secretion system ImpC/EvpB family protein